MKKSDLLSTCLAAGLILGFAGEALAHVANLTGIFDSSGTLTGYQIVLTCNGGDADTSDDFNVSGTCNDESQLATCLQQLGDQCGSVANPGSGDGDGEDSAPGS